MRWVLSYILVASVALWLAFFLSFRFIGQARSQTPGNLPPPSAGDLPPEFMNEAGAPPAQPGSIPPPPSQPPVPPSAPPQQQALPQPPPMPQTQQQPQAVPEVPPSMPVAQPPMPPPEMPMEVVVPQFADDDKYVYDPTGRRDPFKPYRAIRPGPIGASPGVSTPGVPGAQPQKPMIDLADPLQRWDLGRFVVVAILWEVRTPRAMVKDPEGKVFTIAKNTRIGRNEGYVVAIREGEVVVVETIEKEGLQAKEVKILELKK